jgi:hypothetical protein
MMLVDQEGKPLKSKQFPPSEDNFTSFHLKEVTTTTLDVWFDTEEEAKAWLKKKTTTFEQVKAAANASGVTVDQTSSIKQNKTGWAVKIVIKSNKSEKLR